MQYTSYFNDIVHGCSLNFVKIYNHIKPIWHVHVMLIRLVSRITSMQGSFYLNNIVRDFQSNFVQIYNPSKDNWSITSKSSCDYCLNGVQEIHPIVL